jgi:hypothetical protein
LTPLTLNEHSEHAFGIVVSRAQEGTIEPQAAFERTITHAQDGTQSAGRLSAGTYKDSGGPATYTHNKYKVKPSMIDFVIDVHNIANKTLSPAEFSYFKRTYFVEFLGIAEMDSNGVIDQLDSTPDGSDKFFAEHLEKYRPEDRDFIARKDADIRVRLGKAFIEHGLHPFDVYMNHDDLDIRKRFEQ